MAINFDVLHVWEAGDDPVALHWSIRKHVRHYYLKNISERRHLHVFSPGNVYSAAGDRTGLTPLFEGAVDYADIMASIPAITGAAVSLEWFSNDAFNILSRDCETLREHFGFEKPHQFRERGGFLQTAP